MPHASTHTASSHQINGSVAEDPFQQLIQDLRDYLGPSSGIDSADVDVDQLRELMAQYQSNPEEWTRYAVADKSRNYTRNLVDTGNGKSNLIMIVWNPGKGSQIHDHANAHCIMRVLKGSLVETVYNWPEPSDTQDVPLSVKKQTKYQEKEVAYISDQIGLHRISNPNTEDVAVSLHLYTPPNAAHYGFNIYDEKTGKATHIP